MAYDDYKNENPIKAVGTALRKGRSKVAEAKPKAKVKAKAKDGPRLRPEGGGKFTRLDANNKPIGKVGGSDYLGKDYTGEDNVSKRLSYSGKGKKKAATKKKAAVKTSTKSRPKATMKVAGPKRETNDAATTSRARRSIANAGKSPSRVANEQARAKAAVANAGKNPATARSKMKARMSSSSGSMAHPAAAASARDRGRRG